MKVKESIRGRFTIYMDIKTGELFLVATPIGNLEDVTFRAVRILKEVDLIAAEDTRNSKKLLNHFDISTPMVSYHDHNRYDKADELVAVLLGGKNIALISDAGTPGISDPGEVLVMKAIEAGVRVVPIPGAVAGINALIASGMATNHFYFHGFLSRQKKERLKELEFLSKIDSTIILYEAPHRLLKTLELLKDYFDGRICLARELTKLHEEFLRMSILEAIEYYQELKPRGEYVLLLEGGTKVEIKEEVMTVEENIQYFIEQGMSSKDAIKSVAKERGLSRRDVYQTWLNYK